jgi:hypothetical protein
VNWEQIAAYSIDARSRAVAGASFACPQAALLALLERRSQQLASQPAKSCSPGGLTRAGMSDASKVGAPPGRGRSDSLADKTDRFGEQCGWLRDPECGQPKGKR